MIKLLFGHFDYRWRNGNQLEALKMESFQFNSIKSASCSNWKLDDLLLLFLSKRGSARKIGWRMAIFSLFLPWNYQMRQTPPLLPLPVPFLFRPGGGGGGEEEEEEEEEDADCFPLSCFSFRVSLCFSLNDSCVRFLEDTFKFRLIDPFSYRLDRVAPRKPQLLRAIPREIPDSGKCFWIPADIPLNFDWIRANQAETWMRSSEKGNGQIRWAQHQHPCGTLLKTRNIIDVTAADIELICQSIKILPPKAPSVPPSLPPSPPPAWPPSALWRRIQGVTMSLIHFHKRRFHSSHWRLLEDGGKQREPLNHIQRQSIWMKWTRVEWRGN